MLLSKFEDTQIYECHSVKQDDLDEKSIRINTECSVNQDIRCVV